MPAYEFYPRYAQINALTQAQQAVVTFTADHDFTNGEIVSFRVTKDFGMVEIDKKRGRVLSSTSDTITVDIDTSTWTAFTTALLNQAGTTPPVCVPSSSGIVPGNQAISKTNIDDAFDNRRV